MQDTRALSLSTLYTQQEEMLSGAGQPTETAANTKHFCV